jgi:hypothetical protein
LINFGVIVPPMTEPADTDREPVLPMNLPPGLRISGRLRERVIAYAVGRYDQGAAIRAIAEEVNRAYTTTHRLLSEGNARMRPRGALGRDGRDPARTQRKD